MKTNLYLILLTGFLFLSCGKSELEQEKEKIRKESNDLKMKIDSSHIAVDSAKKDLDKLMYRLKRDSSEIDSLMKKINPLKK